MQQLWKICMYQTTSWKWVEMSWIAAKVSSYFTTFEKQMRCGSRSKCFSTAFTMVLLALQAISVCILAQDFLFLLASLLCKGTTGMKWCNVFFPSMWLNGNQENCSAIVWSAIFRIKWEHPVVNTLSGVSHETKKKKNKWKKPTKHPSRKSASKI